MNRYQYQEVMIFRFFITGILLLPPLLMASGTVDGGGGKAVVCRDQANRIVSAETLDLFEGKNLYGVNVLSLGSTVNEEVAAIQLRLNDTLDQLEVHIIPLLGRVRNLDRRTKIIFQS